MLCQKCQKENHSESKFCRFCGQKISHSRHKTLIPEQIAESIPQTTESMNVKQLALPITNLFNWNFSTLKNKLLKNSSVIAVLFSLLIITGAYAAPKINGYIKVNKAIESAKKAEDAKDYNSALSLLASVSDYWMTDSKKQEVDSFKEKQNRNVKYKEIFNSALEKEQAKKLNDARKLLLTIDPDFPEYNAVKDKLSDIQDKIEGKLKADADRESAARANAERQTQIESEARAQAQRETQAATEAKQRSDASAAVAAQAARDAEYRRQQADAAAREAESQRQQAAIQRAEEVKRSFRNELTAGYNAYIQGSNYYISAIQYSNNSNSLLAISQAGSARAVLNTARNTVSGLNYRFTGLPSNYYTAASNMVSAIDNLNQALDLLVSSEGTSLDYSSSINSYKNMAISYAGMVKSFLDANSY